MPTWKNSLSQRDSNQIASGVTGAVQYFVGEVVKNVVAVVGCDSEHSVPLAILFMHNCHEQRLTWPACLDEEALLEQRVAVTGAGAVIGIAPPLNHAVVIHIGLGLDVMIDPIVDATKITQRCLIQRSVERRQGFGVTDPLIGLTELNPSNRRCRCAWTDWLVAIRGKGIARDKRSS